MLEVFQNPKKMSRKSFDRVVASNLKQEFEDQDEHGAVREGKFWRQDTNEINNSKQEQSKAFSGESQHSVTVDTSKLSFSGFGSQHFHFSRGNFDAAEVNRQRGEKRHQWLNNVDRTHLELACGKVVLQKKYFLKLKFFTSA